MAQEEMATDTLSSSSFPLANARWKSVRLIYTLIFAISEQKIHTTPSKKCILRPPKDKCLSLCSFGAKCSLLIGQDKGSISHVPPMEIHVP